MKGNTPEKPRDVWEFGPKMPYVIVKKKHAKEWLLASVEVCKGKQWKERSQDGRGENGLLFR